MYLLLGRQRVKRKSVSELYFASCIQKDVGYLNKYLKKVHTLKIKAGNVETPINKGCLEAVINA